MLAAALQLENRLWLQVCCRGWWSWGCGYEKTGTETKGKYPGDVSIVHLTGSAALDWDGTQKSEQMQDNSAHRVHDQSMS